MLHHYHGTPIDHDTPTNHEALTTIEMR